MNHKRVARIMREDSPLAIQPRAFIVTADSDHKLEIFLNLASRMKLTEINQLWVADITYIRLKSECVYLGIILDSHSRKVVGWALAWCPKPQTLAGWPRCLARLILFGEGSLRRALTEYYQAERNHQGKGNLLLFPSTNTPQVRRGSTVRRTQRLGS